MVDSNQPDGTPPTGFLARQTRIFAAIAAGVPLAQTLAMVSQLAECQVPGAICSILVFGEHDRRLRPGAPADLPAAYDAWVAGLPDGPDGTPPFGREPAAAADLATDPAWERWRGFANAQGLRACWSRPILDRPGGDLLGTVALFFRAPGEPRPADLEILAVAAHLGALAIDRSRHEARFRAVFEHAPAPIFLFGDARRLVEVNPAAGALLGAPRAAIVGQKLDRFLKITPTAGLPGRDERWAHFLRDGRQEGECTVLALDGGRHQISFHARANFLPGLHLCVTEDITRKKLAEAAVRHAEHFYHTLVETTHTGYLVADADGAVLDANAEYIHLSGHERLDDLLGRAHHEWVAPEDRENFAAAMALCREAGHVRNLEVDFVDRSGQRTPVEINATLLNVGESVQLLALCRDVTGRLRTQQELQATRRELESRVERRTAELARANEQIRSRARQQESVAELGRHALAGADIDPLLQEATETVAAILGVEYGAVLEHADPESDQLLRRASVGWPPCAPGAAVASTDPRTVEGYALQAEIPVVFEEIARETRFRPPPGMVEAGVVSGITVTIRDEAGVYGLLCAHGRQRRAFTPDDVHFMEAIANVLAAAIERKRAEETVRLAQMGAVQANNAKIEFLSRMSHELRTPLNAILGFSQLLEIERLSTGQRESVEQITRAGRHLLELVNEVLDISRIDSGNMTLVPEPLAVEELLREAVDLIRPLADMRRIEIRTDPVVLEGGHHVLADRQRLRQVLLNLLSNAVKYNREAGRVTLRGGPSPDGKHLRLSVTDTGLGITPENLPLLFTPFERLGAENTNIEGSGMGLALSRKLMETQGGELGVDSTVGVGSTFWLDLPVAAAPTGELPLFFEELLSSPFFGPDEGGAGGTGFSVPAAPRPPAPPRTVLHIEDNEGNQRLVEMLLAKRPTLKLLTASRGEKGLALAREFRPDLILLDIHLPDTSGVTVLHTLRTDEGTRDTPIVVVSADAAAVRQHQLDDIGANNYLLKPFNVKQFLKILDEYLQRDAT